jgi:hypothetical protein
VWRRDGLRRLPAHDRGRCLAGEPADAGVISLGKGRAQRLAAVANADADTDADAIASDARRAYGNV